MADEEKKSKGGLNPKVFLIGLPLFLIQLVVVYFVTANILLNNVKTYQVNGTIPVGNHGESNGDESESEDGETQADTSSIGKHIYTVDDIVINPAGSNGQRYILVSLGVDVQKESDITSMDEKSIVIKDLINTTFSKKNIQELGNIANRDSIRSELITNLEGLLPSVGINNIYFSKYILQ